MGCYNCNEKTSDQEPNQYGFQTLLNLLGNENVTIDAVKVVYYREWHLLIQVSYTQDGDKIEQTLNLGSFSKKQINLDPLIEITGNPKNLTIVDTSVVYSKKWHLIVGVEYDLDNERTTDQILLGIVK